jgi:hypothetical protein
MSSEAVDALSIEVRISSHHSPHICLKAAEAFIDSEIRKLIPFAFSPLSSLLN